MATWKKIITSGSKAELLNVTSSGGVQIGSLGAGGPSDLVLVQNASTGDIETRTQLQVGDLGSNVNVFATMSAGGFDVTASNSTDTLTLTGGDNIGIVGVDNTNTITLSATTKSISEITTILSESLTSGTHQNITINEPSAGVFSITGSSALTVNDTTGQTGIALHYDTSTTTLSASLTGLTTESSVKFSDITAAGNISASGFISASALDVKNDATIGGNLTLDGNFLFDGYNFETSNILNHSGSNIFGTELSDSHHFTGSISITGSGVTLVDGIFTGDGSGLTNLSAGSLPGGLLSSSYQIESDISGAYTGDQVTINKAGGVFSAITTDGVDSGNAGLATGGDIFTYVNNATQSLSASVANNYISSIANATNGGINVTNGTSGATTLGINIYDLTVQTIAAGDSIAFSDNGDNITKKTTIDQLAAFITGSSAGTVTAVGEGDGIEVTNGTSATPTVAVDAGTNIVVNGDGVSVNPTISITGITAITGSFDTLTVNGSTTVIETEILKISDNFIYLNKDQPDAGPTQDAGISVNRGTSTDANLFWDEGVDRWSLSIADLQTGEPVNATPNAYLTTVSSSHEGPNLAAGPTYGASDGQGNMHIDTVTGDIWMYV